MAELGVNVDHVATLRQVRKATYPDPVMAAQLAEMAGAHQITVHLREDRRHIQERDVRVLRDVVNTRLNLEIACVPEMVKLAIKIKPDSVTFVPERRAELTTEGGLHVSAQKSALSQSVDLLKEAEIKIYLFIDPDSEGIKTAHHLECDGVEFHTGKYCHVYESAKSFRSKTVHAELERLRDAVRLAAKLKLRVAAGHGLHYTNIQPLVNMKEIEEFNIGHSIIARAVQTGMVEAVTSMLKLLA